MADQSTSTENGLTSWFQRILQLRIELTSLVAVIALLAKVPFVLPWLLNAIWISWTARSLVHVAAGYLTTEYRTARRVMRRWFVVELVTSAVIGAEAIVVSRSQHPPLWQCSVLVVIVIAVSIIPNRQAADISALRLPTGSEWMAQHLSRWFADGSDAFVVVLFRKLTSRSPGLSVGNLARLLAASATVALAAATYITIVQNHLEPADSAPIVVSPLLPKQSEPKIVTVRPFISIPTPVELPSEFDDPSVTYQGLCGDSEGGSVPGATAPPWAQEGIYNLVLGPDPMGFGGYVSGCLGATLTVSDSTGTTVWAEGYLRGRLLSVALNSTIGGPCLVLGSAAKPVAELLARKVAVSCEGAPRFGPHGGDGYLVTSRYGTYAFIRGGQWAAGKHTPQPFIELSPGASDAWAEAQRQAGQPLLVVAEGRNTFALTTLDGDATDYKITINRDVVKLKTGAGSFVIKERAILSWQTTIS